MKPLTISLLTVALFLSACTGRTSQKLDTKQQTRTSRSYRANSSPPEQEPASRRARSVWGGFQLNLAMMVTANQSPPALFSSLLSSSALASSPASPSEPPCGSTEDSCNIQHFFPFQLPFSSNFNTAIEPTYLYGTTEFGAREPHHGVEILNPTGTPILAVEDGTVVVAGSDAHHAYGPRENFYGNLVVIAHYLPYIEEPVYTLYGHLSKITVQVGQAVKAGKVIGEVGSTGRAIGSHLHFEVRMGANQYNSTRNPALWLPPRTDDNGQQYGILAGKLDNARGDPIDSTFEAEYYPDIDEAPEKTIYIETYATDIDPIKGDDTYQENFVLVDLPPGQYRIALSASGKWTERWVEVEAGKMSFVSIVSK